MWQLDWGEHIAMLQKRARRGEETPALDGRPFVHEDLGYVWQAFDELHVARPVGFGPCALPPSDILAWMNIHGYSDVEERVELYELLLAMDTQWLSWARDKVDQRKKRKT